MNRISGFCNQAASFFMDSVNPTVNPTIKRIASVALILIGIVALGIAINALWRKLHPLEEENETDSIIGNLFRKIFGGKKDSIEEEVIEEEEVVVENEGVDELNETDEDIVLNNDFTFAKESGMSCEKLRDIQNQLKQNHNGHSNKLVFPDPNGIVYYAWFKDDRQAFNIQTAASFNQNPPTQENKLGFKIDDEGKIESFYIEGVYVQSHLISQELTKEKQALLAALYLAIAPKEIPPSDPVDDLEEEEPVENSPVKDTPQEPLSQFSSADLMTFRAALIQAKKPITVDIGGTPFFVWYNSHFSAINIQDVVNYNQMLQSGKLGIIIDDTGTMTSLRINNIPQADNSLTIPDEFLPRVYACFKKALEISSSYNVNAHPNDWDPAIEITVVRRGIKEVPEFHLHELSQAIEKSIKKEKDPKMTVSFLRNDLTYDQGADEGGLSRDYLDDLMDGIIKSKNLSFKSLKGSLVLPHAKQDAQKPQSLSLLDLQEKALYQELGKLMMYCYHSQVVPGEWEKTYLIGRHFDNSLFNAILRLNAQEINTPFENLSLATKLKMCRALFDAHVETGMNLGFVKQRLDWLDQFDLLDDNQMLKIAQHLLNADCLPGDWTINNKGDELIPEKIKQNRAQLKTLLSDLTFSQEADYGQFGAQLAPIHAIAQGMKLICHPGPGNQHNDNASWDTQIKGIDYQDFSNKVQGSLDRKEIAKQIQLNSNVQGSAKIEIEKKVKWLKEWICDEQNGAREEELKDLLKYLTGSSSLPKDKIIDVKAQISTPYFPVPRVHTCSFKMDVSPVPSQYGFEYNDHTKDNFLKCLKDLALKDPSSYQMM